MPAGADPVTYLMHKVEALGELPPTIGNYYTIPLNPESHLAMDAHHMPSIQCTQCHDMKNRVVTPSPGILISHEAHEDVHISCTVCHNRVAHNEKDRNWKPVNIDPKTGELNRGHEDFMEMTACYRCHRLSDDGQKVRSQYTNASGECSACHTADFDLVPEDHKKPDFVKNEHGPAAEKETERVAEFLSEPHEEEAASGGHDDAEVNAVAHVPSVEAINRCYTCHSQSFCSDCHGGVEMPHPKSFVTSHKEAATEHPDSCAKCHGSGTSACDSCHHSDPNVPGWEYKTNLSWLAQHAEASTKNGAAGCFKCHEPTYCAHCHVTGSAK
jgi:hypothetical protein